MVDQVVVEPRWSERRPVLALAGWLLGALVTLSLLHTAGAGSLSPPLDPSGWAAWISGRDPVVAIVACARIVVLALGWYLLLSVVLGVLARALRSARLIRVADLVTVGPVRRAVGAALGMLLTAGVANAQPAAATPAVAPPLPVELVMGAQHQDGPTTPLSVELVMGEQHHEDPAAPVTQLVDVDAMRPVPRDGVLVFEGPIHTEATSGQGGSDASGSGQATSDQGRSHAGVTGQATSGQGGSDASGSGQATSGHDGAGQAVPDHSGSDQGERLDPTEHRVQPGESFWSIADAVLRAETTEISDSEVAEYWSQLIEANRDRLLVDDDPDLLYPGQWLVLPAVAPTVGS